MLPLPRARLCHEEPPPRERPPIGRTVSRFSRSATSSSSAAHGIRAAVRHATPSRIASLTTALVFGVEPHSASTAFPRLLNSFRYFHRMTSALADEKNVEDWNAAATVVATASTPEG